MSYEPEALRATFFDQSKNYFEYKSGPYGVVPPFEPIISTVGAKV